MGLPAYAIKFEYTEGLSGPGADASRLLAALEHIERFSTGIEARFDPYFCDPAVVQANNILLEEMIAENRISARLKRWWQGKESKFESADVLGTILSSDSTVRLKDYGEGEDWAALAVEAVGKSPAGWLGISIWRERRDGISMNLRLSRDHSKAMRIEGSLFSVAAYEDESLRAKMKEQMGKLEQTAMFVSRESR